MGFDEEKGGLIFFFILVCIHLVVHVIQFEFIICITAYEKLVTEYEILRKAILENNVNITKRIINDLNIDKEVVVNFTPKEDNSLLFM